MTTLMILEYCRGLVSHLILAWQCRNSRSSKSRSTLNTTPKIVTFNSIAGRRTYIDMERRVTELLSTHDRLGTAKQCP